MIIDFHTHLFPPHIREGRERYLARDRTFSHLYSDPRARLCTAEELIESMDANGIDMAVVLNMGWNVHEFCVEVNDYLLESAKRFPDRLIPFCCVNPAVGREAVKEIERCAGLGARGIGEIHSYAQGYRLDDVRIMRPVMETARRYNLVVLTHSSEPVGHIYPGKGTVTPDQLTGLIEAFPEVAIVCAHWGGGLPFYSLMPEVRKALKNVYFDSAASPLIYSPNVFPTVAQLFGEEKVLFGTDFPVITQKRLLNQVEEIGLSEEVEKKFMGENARALLAL